MTAFDRQQSRQVDLLATEQFGISGLILMENAGRACSDVLEAQNFDSIILLCGKGNNAGDGFVIARQLITREIPVTIILLVQPSALTGDAKVNFDILTKLVSAEALEKENSSSILFADTTNISGMLARLQVSERTAIVDCLTGTGGHGAPRTPFDQGIVWANKQLGSRIAIDIPSGLDCNTGDASTPTFLADQTLTLVATKIGFTKEMAKRYTGNVIVLDIGIPLAAIQQ